jgi:hypothetical protein
MSKHSLGWVAWDRILLKSDIKKTATKGVGWHQCPSLKPQNAGFYY